MPSCFQQRARARRESTGGNRIGKRIDFIVAATGKKSERADMYAGDGFFKFTKQGYRVKHRAIAADHHRKIHFTRKCAGRDAIWLASKRRSRLLEPHLDSMRFEGTAQIHKSRQ
jgi:hypothetical protein